MDSRDLRIPWQVLIVVALLFVAASGVASQVIEEEPVWLVSFFALFGVFFGQLAGMKRASN